jgi:predicted ATPase
MITALFLRHYKVYKGLSFVPICNSIDNKFTMFIGNNGVGKSSVLEALNTFFNMGTWNITKDVKTNEAFIAPLFLINKNEVDIKPSYLKNRLDSISNYFWNTNKSSSSFFTSPEFVEFYNFRDELKKSFSPNDYYLILVGINYEDRRKIDFASFTNDMITKGILIPDESDKNDDILSYIRDKYSYIYIPVETSTSAVLKLEGREMQELMNTDTLNEITNILSQEISITKNGENGTKKRNIVEFINESLNNYMDMINDKVGVIDPEYAFKVEGKYKKNLTPADIRVKILEAYFSIRTLKKNKKELNELSSGEQRIALIDIATAFLKDNNNTNKKIVIAIDEPETSLHISKCFNQFIRLEELANKNQVMITSHWYGALPTISNGTLCHLEKSNHIKIQLFNFNNYLEERKNFPDDIILKSYFELVASLISIMKINNENWIICEGSDDKAYIESYLESKICNLRIFSVGGCGNVMKLYKYLYVPFNEKTEKQYLKGKVLCLIDSDREQKYMDIPSETENKKLKIARIQLENNNTILLRDLINAGVYEATEIEDCLEPDLLYRALVQAITIGGDSQIKQALTAFEYNENAKNSRIKGEVSILKPNKIDYLAEKEKICNFIDINANKYLVAKLYTEYARTSTKTPKLFENIKSYFEN